MLLLALSSRVSPTILINNNINFVPPLAFIKPKERAVSPNQGLQFLWFHVRLIGNVVRYHQSFVGRDYKAWAQMAPFVLFPYLAEEHRTLWSALSRVSSLAWCDLYKYYHYQFCEGLEVQDCLL